MGTGASDQIRGGHHFDGGLDRLIKLGGGGGQGLEVWWWWRGLGVGDWGLLELDHFPGGILNAQRLLNDRRCNNIKVLLHIVYKIHLPSPPMPFKPSSR